MNNTTELDKNIEKVESIFNEIKNKVNAIKASPANKTKVDTFYEYNKKLNNKLYYNAKKNMYYTEGDDIIILYILNQKTLDDLIIEYKLVEDTYNKILPILESYDSKINKIVKLLEKPKSFFTSLSEKDRLKKEEERNILIQKMKKYKNDKNKLVFYKNLYKRVIEFKNNIIKENVIITNTNPTKNNIIIKLNSNNSTKLAKLNEIRENVITNTNFTTKNRTNIINRINEISNKIK